MGSGILSAGRQRYQTWKRIQGNLQTLGIQKKIFWPRCQVEDSFYGRGLILSKRRDFDLLRQLWIKSRTATYAAWGRRKNKLSEVLIETEQICAATDKGAESLEGRQGKIITNHEFKNIDLRRFINDKSLNRNDVEGAVIMQ